jgi:hypothetical protein
VSRKSILSNKRQSQEEEEKDIDWLKIEIKPLNKSTLPIDEIPIRPQ